MNLEQKIEEAFHYRGNVTLTLKSGEIVEGFLFNREFKNPRLEKDCFVEIFPVGREPQRMIDLSEVVTCDITGEDCAAGKSYEEWLKKQETKKAS